MAQLLELMEANDGYRSIHESPRPANWNQRLDALIGVIENRDGLMQHVRDFALREVMTTDDFPLLFADSLEREVLARLAIAKPNCMRIARRGSVRDFRTVKRFRYDGLSGRLQRVQEKAEYLAGELDETRYTYNLNKYGRQVDFSWEAMINDDLNAFGDVPQRLADACTATLEWFITDLFWNAGGPSAAMFGNTPAATALTIGALENAVEAMAAYTDPTTAEPISNRPKYLMVGPALEFTARQILTSALKMWTESAGGAAVAYPTANVIGQYGLELIVNPWIPIVDTTSGATTWALFCDPRDLAACEVGFLRGHESPELYMKSSDQVRVGGGGLTDPFGGDFATDDVFFKVRYVFGGTVMNTLGNWAAGAVTP